MIQYHFKVESDKSGWRPKQKLYIKYDTEFWQNKANRDITILNIFIGDIERHGIRRDFDAAITDINLRGSSRIRISKMELSRLRTLTEGKDSDIELGLIFPRIEIIKQIINQLKQ